MYPSLAAGGAMTIISISRPAYSAALQSAVRAAFNRHLSLARVAPVRERHLAAACPARRFRNLPAAVAFPVGHIHHAFTGLSDYPELCDGAIRDKIILSTPCEANWQI